MYSPAQTTTARYRPGWVEDLTTFYRGRIARQFVIHFNITDFVMDLSRLEEPTGEYMRTGEVVDNRDQLPTMREYLHEFLFEAVGCHAIYTYSLAGGLVALDAPRKVATTALEREMLVPAKQRLLGAWRALSSPQPDQNGSTQNTTGEQRTQPKEQEIDLPKDNEIADNFKILSHMLRQPYYLRQNSSQKNPEVPIAVVLDYVEKLIPYRLGEGQGDREQLQALEVVQRWALDPDIRKTNNLIILLTTNIGQIPPSVYAEGSGCRAIRVPLPDSGERMAFINYKMTKALSRLVNLDSTFGKTLDEQARYLARNTQGMRLSDIDNVSRRVIIETQKRDRNAIAVLTTADVQRAKAEVIQAQSEQLLEIVPPVRGFKQIGGLEKLKAYLRTRTDLMASGDRSPLVPGGLLLAGPPGTGKTIIAEALAFEGKFNLVKMRNIQDKWIGSSERNLELVMNLLKDLHPVVVFIDEIDQAMSRRDTGQSGDSGVGARMFARILEVMSDATNRGRILWVAATNRADILDEALLRRFDRVVPLLTPDVEESCRIFATMPDTISAQSGGTIKVAYGGDLDQKNETDIEKFRSLAEKTTALGLTGAGIEVVVRRAIEMAYEEALSKKASLSGDAGGRMDEEAPKIEIHHLSDGLNDYKPNHNRLAYDYQSLLAIRACNFRSVIPPLPREGVYADIQNEYGEINPDKLEAAIMKVEQQLRSRR